MTTLTARNDETPHAATAPAADSPNRTAGDCGENDSFKLLGAVGRVRGDEQGSILLLSAMMVFAFAIFGVLAIDTNKAVYNRIVSQNAVDAAADAAALWQARGCNLLQLLNNLHYTVDIVAYVGEAAATAACIIAVPLVVAGKIPIVGPAFEAARIVACVICNTGPPIDAGQQQIAKAILFMQKLIANGFPILAFAHANAAAKGSGADSLVVVAPQFAGSMMTSLGLPGANSISSLAGGIPGFAGSVPLFAFPLDPRSLSLSVDEKKGEGFPWQCPEIIGKAGEIAGRIGCYDNYNIGLSIANGMGWDKKWGWDDKYYFGNPGFMTWIAGKTNETELARLGKLKWLKGGSPPPEIQYSWMNQRNLRMFTDSGIVQNQELRIPAFLAIASSQVEGTPVISHGDADARGKIIKVYLPPSGKEMENLLIYH